MPVTIAVRPELIRWAIRRSGLSADDLSQFPLDEWQNGVKQPTVKQLERFAKRTMTPLGFLFLPKPPVERLPIPDFRTVGDKPIDRPSPNLIDTIHDMQRRQLWMREYLIEQGYERLAFEGSLSTEASVKEAAQAIRETLHLAVDWAERETTWEEALRVLRRRIDDAGVLVAVSGIVGNNTRRKLDPQEFRGFVLADHVAPLVFVNGADSKSAQMFTLAHELVHVWLGKDGLFNLIEMRPHNDDVERFCNRVAAEFLVPSEKLSHVWPEARQASEPFERIARTFKVSPLVVARRALDLKFITGDEFFSFYHQYLEKIERLEREKPSGGNFYRNVDVRLGRRFALAVIHAAREGTLLYRDAYQLTGLYGQTFDKYALRMAETMEP
jgi:Zn-dependent peptidase ImmA (M78 family)